MSADSLKGFKDIIFGKAAAEHEKSHRYRKLLLEGFLDEYGYIDRLLNDDKFLVLGLKGSGKSAIAVRLELLSEQRDDMIVTNYEISSQFPFQLFSKLMDLHKYEAKITKFQYYWEYLILVVFLESFSRDDTLIYKDRKQAEKLLHVLKRLKLMPTKSLMNLVTKTTCEGFEANLDNILKSSSSKSSSAQSTIGESLVFNILREVCYSVAVKNKHILIIDGLDSIMTPQSD